MVSEPARSVEDEAVGEGLRGLEVQLRESQGRSRVPSQGKGRTGGRGDDQIKIIPTERKKEKKAK